MVPAPRTKIRLAVMLGTLGILFALVPVSPVLGASDKLPDLRVATTTDFRIVRTSTGRRLLRFSGMMMNLGRGPFELRARRASTSAPWTVDQVIYRSGAGTRRIHTTATMQYAGDGHNHWHVQRMLTFHLWSPTSATLRSAKIGFCFFDTNRYSHVLAGTPRTAHYAKTGCGTKSAVSVKVGISVGWADLYPSSFAYQWIDITGLPSGTYTVRGAVDLYGKFTEASETNNCIWSRISFGMTGTKVKVLASGHACYNDHMAMPLAADIGWAVAAGVAKNCDADMFCTTDVLTRAEVATYVANAMHLPATDSDYFTDDNGTSHEADINRVAAAGVMAGCTAMTFCPTGTVSRGTMATILDAALHLSPAGSDPFTDDNGTADEPHINAVAEAGIMAGCTATTFCPTVAIRRGETMGFLHRAFGTGPSADAAGGSVGALTGQDASSASAHLVGYLRSAEVDQANWIAAPGVFSPSDAIDDPFGTEPAEGLVTLFECVIGS